MRSLEKTVQYLKELGNAPERAIILGSGLGELVDRVEDKKVTPYGEIPQFPRCGVVGHGGNFVTGKLGGQGVAILQGRIHYYEGHPMADVVFATRALILWGVKELIVTNAAGGINSDYRAGEIVQIRDHINLMGSNPLLGTNNDTWGPRFPDLTEVYDKKVRQVFQEVAKEHNIDLKEGVYTAVSGPTYETPAEVKMLETIGADMVGMSTIPEAIVCRHMGARVAALSCITNLAAGLSDKTIDHSHIKDTAKMAMDDFCGLIIGYFNATA